MTFHRLLAGKLLPRSVHERHSQIIAEQIFVLQCGKLPPAEIFGCQRIFLVMKNFRQKCKIQAEKNSIGEGGIYGQS